MRCRCWGRREVVARTPNPVHHAAEAGTVELDEEAGVHGEPDVLGPRPVLAAVERPDQDVRPLPRLTDGELIREHVTTPWLSVRTVQRERPKPCFVLKGLVLAGVTCFVLKGLVLAGATCFCVQVSPPSVDVATVSGCGRARPFSWLRKEAKQTYTWPKNGLLAALSAQIWSLSEKVVTTAC